MNVPDGDERPPAGSVGSAGDPVEHFWRAAHELLMAARALIDAADAVVEQQLRAKESREPRLRRIDVL